MTLCRLGYSVRHWQSRTTDCSLYALTSTISLRRLVTSQLRTVTLLVRSLPWPSVAQHT